jgi:hypothetical protein
MSKKISPQNNSANQQNPNNKAFQLSHDNRSRQLNPNHNEYKLNQDVRGKQMNPNQPPLKPVTKPS